MKIGYNYKSNTLFMLFILFLAIVSSIGCNKKTNDCIDSEVAFELDIDLSSVLDHETTDQSTNVKIYYENYVKLGDMEAYQQYSLAPTGNFRASICLPISDFPTDSIIIGLKLIQNNNEAVKDPTIYLNVPYSKTDVNCIEETINSTYLWDKPPCLTMPTVFQNLEDYIDEDQPYNMNVAGGYGIGLNSGGGTLEEINQLGDSWLLDYYYGGLCPCSKYYVEFQ